PPARSGPLGRGAAPDARGGMERPVETPQLVAAPNELLQLTGRATSPARELASAGAAGNSTAAFGFGSASVESPPLFSFFFIFLLDRVLRPFYPHKLIHHAHYFAGSRRPTRSSPLTSFHSPRSLPRGTEGRGSSGPRRLEARTKPLCASPHI